MIKRNSFQTGKRVAAIVILSSMLLAASCDNGESEDPNAKVIPEESTFFSTVYVEPASTKHSYSDGDLWPVAWSDDDVLYTANGDGVGFDFAQEWSDIVVNKLTGEPSSEKGVMGERLASGDAVGKVWSDPDKYNRKPTGMVSVGGVLYLAVQDLSKDDKTGDIFNEALAATIYKSTDKGKTWTAGGSPPMFKNHMFTTVMFLDYGKDGANNSFDNYVYAYGLDFNWRDSFNNKVTDPTKMYLARMPKDKIQDAGAWEFYKGNLKGKAKWTGPGDITGRKPVLQDDRRVYTDRLSPELGNMSVISQGSIVYNKPLDRYLYTSWTEFTFEFYEAPKPWGPWKHFYSADFGIYPWSAEKNGGYATVIPSKFISEDGREMWINSNTFVGGVKNYNFSLRKMKVTPYKKSNPANKKNEDNLALPIYDPNVASFSRTIGNGGPARLNDGKKGESTDSWNGERKKEDWWGYTWSSAYNMNKVVYTAGESSASGGWFDNIRVQVRQNLKWVDVKNAIIAPVYPANAIAKGNTYTFTFNDTWGDGVRIIGKPGGEETYTAIEELEVYYSE